MSELSGTTLKVYLYILKSGKEKVGVREVMRGLNMKTPSHAYYHLDKLASMGLLRKKHGDYYIVRELKIDYLRDFLLIGKTLIPKFLFFFLYFTTIFIFSLIYMRPYELFWYITVTTTLSGSIISLYQTISTYRKILI